jgi:hypothetical protein
LELQYFEFFSLLTIPHPWPIKNTDVVLLWSTSSNEFCWTRC